MTATGRDRSASAPTHEAVVRALCQVIAEVTELPPEKVVPSARIEGDLGMDSMEVMSVIDLVSDAIGCEMDVVIPASSDDPGDVADLSVAELASFLEPLDGADT